MAGQRVTAQVEADPHLLQERIGPVEHADGRGRRNHHDGPPLGPNRLDHETLVAQRRGANVDPSAGCHSGQNGVGWGRTDEDHRPRRGLLPGASSPIGSTLPEIR